MEHELLFKLVELFIFIPLLLFMVCGLFLMPVIVFLSLSHLGWCFARRRMSPVKCPATFALFVVGVGVFIGIFIIDPGLAVVSKFVTSGVVTLVLPVTVGFFAAWEQKRAGRSDASAVPPLAIICVLYVSIGFYIMALATVMSAGA